MIDYSIAFIIPYYGKWPVWFPAFLTSCRFNPSIHWLFFTDCDDTIERPNNVKLFKSTLDELKFKISHVCGFNVSIEHPYKVCEFRPAFGEIFKKELTDYDFWGYTDTDIIYGDIRKFITNDLLEDYDMISALPYMMAGHFSLFRNSERINSIYRCNEIYKNYFQPKTYKRFDEYGFTELLVKNKDSIKVNVFWNKKNLENGIKAVNHQEYDLDAWEFEDGKLFELRNGIHIKEYMYLHFINWKPYIKFCAFRYSDKVDSFLISYNKIHFECHTKYQIKLNSLKNVFNGRWVKEKRRKRLLKYKSLIKRLKHKLKYTISRI